MDPPHYALTPLDVMALRLSCPSLRNLGGGVNLGAPYVLYLPADDTFCLHAYGSPQAKSDNLGVLGACLRAERAEPGFIRRILSATEPPDVASLAPDARLAHAARQRGEALARDALTAQRAAEAARRVAALNTARLSLDDL